ncbi:MAG: hypothetical protein J1E61_07115 [Lachnospiraceae bacterium]|nr:hypothetical protein [Lachnospiraceae bacterium]
MKLSDKEVLKETVQEAELVLVGIGEEWGVSFEDMMKETSFSKAYSLLSSDEERERLVPYLQWDYYNAFHDETLKKAYENLHRLLDGKNYFMLSMNLDRYPDLSGFMKDRCVYPCGGYIHLQCDEGCSDTLLEADSLSKEVCKNMREARGEKPDVICCPQCGKPMSFNNIMAQNYVEAGYLPAWNTYMKWLQGTVNKKLCLLELGVSLRIPSVIRWPFERTVFYNQKAKMFRIHHSLSQAAENIGDRCFSIEENSLKYMENLFVS